jgi:CRISPR-associated endonuclease/helicase Cas3
MLTADQFPEFFERVHGWPCFPWQRDLIRRVLDQGRWPDLVDVPTGLGKTSMLDIAVFVAAATSGHGGGDRVGRRRILFVVDRRLVVDEAGDHARDLAQKLADAERNDGGGVVGLVAAGLRAFAPAAGGEVLSVTTMRGGTTWDASWLDRPDRPGIVLGTVDQVGSRLLFRGYGVSERRRSLDAALVGADALLLVDEAHLATALTTTVAAARERDRLGLPLPGLDVVQLSATGRRPVDPFVLDPDAHRTHPVAWERLTAAKDLFQVETTAKDCVGVMAGTAARLLQAHLGGAGAPTALVVCNTVDRARAVHSLLAQPDKADGGHPEWVCDLLIGRSRPLDRQGLQERVLARYGSRRHEGGTQASSRPAILVATQTVEVGVNLDVDVLVTESASWDAIVQRLGRLNRLGTYNARFPARAAAPVVVVHDGVADGPVYGKARDRVWATLAALAPVADERLLDGHTDVRGVSVSPLACRDLPGLGSDDGEEPAAPPVLLVPHLDAWAATGPSPATDPPIDAYLHGFDSGRPAVTVAWRQGMLADPDWADPFEDTPAELPHAVLDQLLTAMPLRAAEQVDVPFLAVRQWMSGGAPPLVSDVESAPESEARPAQQREPFRVLALRSQSRGADTDTGSSQRWQWIQDTQLRPGDTIVVPAERGGLDTFGWNPGGRVAVTEVSEAATFALTGTRASQATLRLDEGLPGRLALNGTAASNVLSALRQLRESEAASEQSADPGQVITALRAAVALQEQLSHAELPTTTETPHLPFDHLLAWLDRGPRLVQVLDSRGGVLADGDPSVLAFLLTGPDEPPRAGSGGSSRVDGDGIIRDDDGPAASSIARRSIPLSEHLDAVAQRADQIARALHLPEDLTQVLADAARWHDLGKAEERFQVMLHGGDPYASALAVDPLAKSGMDSQDRVSWVRARHRSGLPAGARHEAWSLALVEAYLQERPDPYVGDTDLLLHLIASHHGWSRPWLPLVFDSQPRPVTGQIDGMRVTVSSGQTVSLDGPARFARLNTRYGRWGLALLESVVRSADMTVSAEGS